MMDSDLNNYALAVARTKNNTTRTSNPGFSLPAEWEFELIKDFPYRAIAIKTPFGRLAVVTSFSRHPENILFELASEIINQQTKE